MNQLKVCAFCQNENFHELTDINQAIPSEKTIAEKLIIINPEIVFTNDGVINYLCIGCVTKVNDFYNYRDKWAENSKRHNFYKSKISASLSATIVIRDDEIKIEEKPLVKDLQDNIILQKVLNPENILPGPNEMEFPCYLCNALLRDAESLEHHKLIHNSSKPNLPRSKITTRSKTVGTRRQKKGNNYKQSKSDRICNFCTLIFKTPEELIAHNDCPLKNCCPYCKKKFPAKSKLERHITIHTKKFKCTRCQKRFSNEASLKSHQKMHTFQCDQCEKSFRFRRSLNNHKKNHEMF